MKTGAVIIASGDYEEEQRENEGIHLFLPMYPLDGTTVTWAGTDESPRFPAAPPHRCV